MIFLLVALFFKNPKVKRWSLIASFLVLIVFSNPYLLFQFAKRWDVAPGELKKGKVYSAAIILGGFTSEDKNGKGFFNKHADRLIQGMRLKTIGKVSHIFMSGGNADIQPDQFTESAWVKVVLKEFNFPDSTILIEKKSRNTAENAAYTKESLAKAHLSPPYLLVTSAFHMRRAVYIFKKAGVDVIPSPCNYLIGNTGGLSFLEGMTPDAEILTDWGFYLKEVFGLGVAHF
ncbi:MAG: YdcF family protein [Mucilaginibacter sp.]